MGRFGAHHLLWINALQQVEDGKIKRLLGMFPPGAAKSTYTSIVFPTHHLGRFPKTSIILASYGADLPRKFGRRARSIVQQPIYKRIFDTELSEESSAVDEWALTNGSEWLAKGILTGITGNRADGIIWDDLIKGRQEADSDITRQKTWEAYLEDLLTRKKPQAFEIGITTRWHEDDVAGRILPDAYDGESGWVKGKDGNDWYVLCLPAECDREDDPLGRKIGDILWPEWFTPEHFAPYKREARTWSALFQQKPAPDTGVFFSAEWLKPYRQDQLPDIKSLTIYGASDYAVTEGGGDYTVHLVVGMDTEQRLYLLNLYRARVASDIWAEKFCDFVEEYHPLGWAEETGQVNAGVGPWLEKRLRQRRLYIARAQFPSRAIKQVRAQAIRGWMSMNGLYCPTYAPWYPSFHKELMSFPAGRTDDQVDALSLIGQVLDMMVAGKQSAPPPPPPKVLSTDPKLCTVTLTDLFDANERRYKSGNLRIH